MKKYATIFHFCTYSRVKIDVFYDDQTFTVFVPDKTVRISFITNACWKNKQTNKQSPSIPNHSTCSEKFSTDWRQETAKKERWTIRFHFICQGIRWASQEKITNSFIRRGVACASHAYNSFTPVSSEGNLWITKRAKQFRYHFTAVAFTELHGQQLQQS